MPLDPRGLVPGSIIQNQDLAHPLLFGNGFGHFIQEELKYIRIYPIDHQTEKRSGLGGYRANDVLSDMVSQIRHRASFAGLNPTPTRPGVSFDSTFVTEPQLHLW